jgi:predicted nucleic acid-binding protein
MSASERDRRVFVDTSAYYAAVDRRDASHAAVAATMPVLLAERRQLTTTNAVLFELHGLLLNRLGRRVAWETLGELRASQMVVRVRERDETRAEAILAQYDDKDFSLTDALSFAVMERLGIRTAFSLDRHFAQFGWTIVPLAQAERETQR